MISGFLISWVFFFLLIAAKDNVHGGEPWGPSEGVRNDLRDVGGLSKQGFVLV